MSLKGTGIGYFKPSHQYLAFVMPVCAGTYMCVCMINLYEGKDKFYPVWYIR